MATGVVVIGRNERERLRKRLKSLLPAACAVVYVDSGSADNSVAIAKSLACHIVELDPARPYSAARARNEGFAHLVGRYPAIRFVQFIDGDCEIIADWIPAAVAVLVCARIAGDTPGRTSDVHSRRGTATRILLVRLAPTLFRQAPRCRWARSG